MKRFDGENEYRMLNLELRKQKTEGRGRKTVVVRPFDYAQGDPLNDSGSLYQFGDLCEMGVVGGPEQFK